MPKTKVGIITLTDSNNYGNVLQNYAVQETLSALGAEAQTIRNTTRFGHYNNNDKKVCKLTPSYINRYIKTQLSYRYNIKNSGEGILYTLRFCKKNAVSLNEAKKKRKDAFNAFTDKFINWAEKDININYPWTDEDANEYEFYVSGSDQVWNPVYPHTSSINFLTFAPESKRITFSPSFGVNELPENLRPQYAKWLKGIPYLSVREEKGREIIKDLCGRDAVVLCDPTMTISKEKWVEIEEKPLFLGDEKYLLTYFLGDRTKTYQKYIDKIANDNGLQVINLFDVLDLEAYAVSPTEFIYLIHNADLVCTDSFHGTVFSIIMKTNFVTFPRVEIGGSMESRIKTLLASFSLENRSYKLLKKDELFKTDFSKTDDILEAKRNEALSFLKNALETTHLTEEKPKSVYSYIKKNCCGCSACAESCPVNCIKMKRDEEGFLYPEINHELCINCGKCNMVCPFQNNKIGDDGEKNCYVAYSADVKTRKESSSGGVFTELAKRVIADNGVVFGAAFDKNFKVVHTSAEDEKGLSVFRGSKYVQSEIGSAYGQVKTMLEKGKTVYFSGTPCQIKGLKTYLGKDYDNLITQDIICHGVPSPLVFEKYLDFIDKDIKQVSFRHKKYGWHYFSMLIKGRKKHIKRLDEDVYLRLFLDNTTLRPSCYDCLLKKEGGCADITLADCWNMATIGAKTPDDDKGLSLVIVNTEKGQYLWDSIGQKCLNKDKVDTDRAMSSQSAINTSVSPNPKRAVFFEALARGEEKDLFGGWYKKNPIAKFKRVIGFCKFKIKRSLK